MTTDLTKFKACATRKRQHTLACEGFFYRAMKISENRLRKFIREQLSGYDNNETMNRAIMDAIFDRPLGEVEIVNIAQSAAPEAEAGEVQDFIEALLDQGTIEWNEDIGMYDLP